MGVFAKAFFHRRWHRAHPHFRVEYIYANNENACRKPHFWGTPTVRYKGDKQGEASPLTLGIGVPPYSATKEESLWYVHVTLCYGMVVGPPHLSLKNTISNRHEVA